MEGMILVEVKEQPVVRALRDANKFWMSVTILPTTERA